MCKDLVIIAAKTNTKNAAARNQKAEWVAPLGNGAATWFADSDSQSRRLIDVCIAVAEFSVC